LGKFFTTFIEKVKYVEDFLESVTFPVSEKSGFLPPLTVLELYLFICIQENLTTLLIIVTNSWNFCWGNEEGFIEFLEFFI
jgi:hypothetical protein